MYTIHKSEILCNMHPELLQFFMNPAGDYCCLYVKLKKALFYYAVEFFEFY